VLHVCEQGVATYALLLRKRGLELKTPGETLFRLDRNSPFGSVDTNATVSAFREGKREERVVGGWQRSMPFECRPRGLHLWSWCKMRPVSQKKRERALKADNICIKLVQDTFAGLECVPAGDNEHGVQRRMHADLRMVLGKCANAILSAMMLAQLKG
jgi:hypothetical protein